MVGQLALRAFLFAIGLAAIGVFFLSIIRVTLLTRHRKDWLQDLVLGFVHATFKFFLRGTRSREARDRALIYEAPVAIILLIGTWYVLVIGGFGGIFYAIDAQLVARSLISSGMSLSTLGSVTGVTNIGKYLAVAEGGIGLGIVALLVAWIPVLITFVQQREDRVTFLAARTGPQPSGPAIIEWYYRAGQVQQLEDGWTTWEEWLEDLAETHSSLSLLALFRSYVPGGSWVTTVGAITDAAALVSTTLDVPKNATVDIVLMAGAGAICTVATALSIPCEVPLPLEDIGVTRAQFEASCERLQNAGAPLKADRDQAWHDFVALRALYDDALFGLTKELEVPVPAWPTRGERRRES